VSALGPAVINQRPPLVVDLGRGAFAWVEHGFGFILHTGSRQWVPLVDAEGFGGVVLHTDKVAELVAEFGRPTP
jgi:hypothetical protein